MDGRYKAIINEESILRTINEQRWIREDELALLTGMSLAMIRRTCERLARAKEIYRDKKPGGIFLRLKVAGAKKVDGRSGKGIEIPNSWQHDCLAIQALHYLKHAFKNPQGLTIETEAKLRRRQQTGKIADGTLQPRNYYFEMEYSRKSGPAMSTQAQAIATEAKSGRGCIVAYPHPPEFCQCGNGVPINHEHRQTVAIRQAWGDADAQNIRLLRCIFESRIDHRNGRAKRFQLIELPSLPSNARIDPRRTVDELMGYRWKHRDIRQGSEYKISSILSYQTTPVCSLLFQESQSEDVCHQVELDGEVIFARDDEAFVDFIIRFQNEIVKMK
jgi:hypothetical protein